MKAWKVECMCLVCHGPLVVKKTRTAMTCGINCRTNWHNRGLQGFPLAPVYQEARAMHAHRRGYAAVLRRIEELSGFALLERLTHAG